MTPCTPSDALAVILPLAAFHVLDHVYPRHSGLLYTVHPVRLVYHAARRLARPYSGVARGLAVLLVVTLAAVAPVAAAQCLLAPHPMAWAVLATAVLKFSAAFRLLADTAERVARALEDGDLDSARSLVGEIVRRPTGSLDAWRVASAAIESLAENLVDGLTSPLTYYPLLGPAGPMLQRVSNTLDGAIGYRTPEYERVGKPSAHLDTLINLVPARLTAVLISLLAPVAGGSTMGALKAWARWRGATPSMNAGHPIAAMAGALGVRLEKPGAYTVNPEGRPPTPDDVRRAARIARAAAAVYTTAVAAAAALLAPAG